MSLEKVFLQVGRDLDATIIQAGKTLNAAIASSLTNLVSTNAASAVSAIPKRRGPVPKSAIPAAAKGKPGRKPGPQKAAAKTASKAAKANGGSASTSSVAKGRRAVANGDRPKAVDAIAQVIGNSTMSAADVVAGLEKHGWLPNTNKPQNYISFLLSSNSEVFERVERGQYKVLKGARLGKASRASSEQTGNSEIVETESEDPVVDEAQTSEASSPPTSTNETADLVDLGVIGENGQIAGNPYA